MKGGGGGGGFSGSVEIGCVVSRCVCENGLIEDEE